MIDLVERLRRAHNDDHERGCDGRTYVCSCGYDHAIFAAADEAADRIESLEREAEELRAAVIEECANVAEAEVMGVTLDVFVFNGVKAKNTAGHDTFMSTEHVSELLRKRAAAIRALSTRPRQPTEAEGRTE